MPIGPHAPIPRKDKISVAFLVEKLRKKVQIELEACVNDGACENRFITEQELHRPGLAMAGFVELYTHQRIQILGNTECEYLRKFDIDGQKQAFSKILEFDVPVIFLTHGNRIPDELLDMAAVFSIPIFRTPMETTKFMFQLRDFLEDQFALQTVVHGSMVDVYGIGILITGKSGIGKSEVALDLIERGHRLVADDVVMLTRKSNIVMAASTDMNKHFMEIRGWASSKSFRCSAYGPSGIRNGLKLWWSCSCGRKAGKSIGPDWKKTPFPCWTSIYPSSTFRSHLARTSL